MPTTSPTVSPTTSSGFWNKRSSPGATAAAAIAGLVLFYLVFAISGATLNAVVLSIIVMVTLCLVRVPVTIALLLGALSGGLHSGLGVAGSLDAFNSNILVGAQVGLTYIMVGALAVALARSGLIELFSSRLSRRIGTAPQSSTAATKWTLYGLLALVAVLSQNAIPVHIAFIPILIPPLLSTFNQLQIDRRAVACILACMMSASYLLLPVGFGAIYLEEILVPNANEFGASFGLHVTPEMAPNTMFWPVMGLIAGMFFAVFITYRKKREYPEPAPNSTTQAEITTASPHVRPFPLIMTIVAIVVVLVCQFAFDSLMLGAMLSFMVLSLSGLFSWSEQDDVFTQGILMMANIAVIITVASGFAGLLEATGHIQPLIEATAGFIGENKAFAAFFLLIVGLFLTIGFGDSFASVPILAPIYIPLALTLGFSPLATLSLLGASAALGDAGSPASTISLGVTSGLNGDGRHDHIRDTVIPTFFHCNIGMLLFGAAAALLP